MRSKLFILFLLIGLSNAQAQYYNLLERLKSPQDSIIKAKVWQMNLTFGLNGSYAKNTNVAPGTGQEGLSATLTFDLNIAKKEGRFISSNEFHYVSSFFKSGEKNSRVNKTSDNLLTLHDWAIRNGNDSKWHINCIVKFITPLISTFKGGLFTSVDPKQIKIEKFGNPYDINLAPGIKYALFNKKLNLSISPYAIRFYGVTEQSIADQNIYEIGAIDSISGKKLKYKKEKKGAEINIWFDYAVKDILTFEYRVDISSKYSDTPLQEGLFNALLITKLKLVKNLFLTHRANLNGVLEQDPQKPEWKQTWLLSYNVIL
jgi:hypothetical protein